jgi:hypothetical protein
LLDTLDSDSNITKEKTTILAKIFNKVFSPSPLIAARYLRKQYEDTLKKEKNLCPIHSRSIPKKGIAFEEAVRNAIYEDLIDGTESELFKEIRQLCIGSRPNSAIDSIITYNYDNILETYLSRSEINIPHKIIDSAEIKHNENEIPIYHVHGFLPPNEELEKDKKIILSEEMYHEQYKDVYNWGNFTQITKFKDFTCLFIGVSFVDPDLRRLLDIANLLNRNSNIEHYIIREKYDLKQTKDKLREILSTDTDLYNEKLDSQFELDELTSELIKIMQKFQETDALSFNVSTIWVNNYTSDIPEILKNIRKTK